MQRTWWGQYSGSIAFLSVLVVVAFAFWADHARIVRLEKAEREIVQINEALHARQERRLMDALADSIARVDREQRHATELERDRANLLRQATLATCRSSNVLRARLRTLAREQLYFSAQLTRSATMPDKSLEEFTRIMVAREAAWRSLYRDMSPINCQSAK